MMNQLIEPKQKGITKFIFFSGKGGVGKSTMSCATAVWLAKKRYNTLLVTTDPAPNLSDIFGQKIGNNATQITSLPFLHAIEIDPDAAAREYKDRMLEPLKNLLSKDQLKATEEQLDSPCIEEVAAFDKFIQYMDDAQFDVVIFDTAPTGHTLRLLELPSGWSSEIDKGGSTCLGPSESLQAENEKYKKAVHSLQDREKTSFIFVLKPEDISLKETMRSSEELEKIGIGLSALIINGILPDEACTDEFSKTIRQNQAAIMGLIDNAFPSIEKTPYPLMESEINGIALLESVSNTLFDGEPAGRSPKQDEAIRIDLSVDKKKVFSLISPMNGTRFLFFTGKGGVGKSTIACATSVYLAEKGFKTLIVTTDPASHLENIFGQEVNYEPTAVIGQKNLFASRIDQKKTFEEYKERIMKHVMQKFSERKGIIIDQEATKRKIEEDLRSPCAQEMAAFEKFMSFFEMTDYEVVVIDTAPTGHTMHLLELPVEWKGFIDIGTLTKDTSDETSRKYAKIINTMRDPEKSTFVIVMFPEYTPIIEAFRASEELKTQVGIKTGLVAVNYILSDAVGKNEFFNNRRKQQSKYLAEIQNRFHTPFITAPLLEHEPEGLDALKKLGKDVFGD